MPTLGRRHSYGGTILKSYFECCVAALIEDCGHTWEYEPYVYHGNRRTAYKPDFWIGGLRLWIEPRGYEGEASARQIEAFGAAIVKGATTWGNETRGLTQYSVRLHDPDAPVWEYSDYLVMHGSLARRTRFDLYQCHRKTGGVQWGFQRDVGDLVRRYCEGCRHWSLTRWQMKTCGWCGRPARDDAPFDYIVGLEKYGVGLERPGGAVARIENPRAVPLRDGS